MTGECQEIDGLKKRLDKLSRLYITIVGMQSNSSQSIVKQRVHKRRLSQEEQQTIVDLSTRPLSQKEIAQVVDCDDTTVCKVLKRYGIEQRELQEDKDNLADIFLGTSIKLIKSVSEDEIKKMPPASRFLSSGIMYDKYRLETGQATSINVNALVDVLEAIRGLRDK